MDGISHRMLRCPVAHAVWSWVAALWVACTGASAPPLTAPVLLLGDVAAWDPGGRQARVRWTILRLAALFFLFTCVPAERALQPAEPARVVARIVSYLRERIRQDFTRATSSPAAIAIADPTRLPRDRRGSLPFTERWGGMGALCTVQDGALTVHLSVSHPVPLPPAV